ncbi:hypothetical protein HDU98_002984, partial [Podochytrium sp. JEL0797]
MEGFCRNTIYIMEETIKRAVSVYLQAARRTPFEFDANDSINLDLIVAKCRKPILDYARTKVRDTLNSKTKEKIKSDKMYTIPGEIQVSAEDMDKANLVATFKAHPTVIRATSELLINRLTDANPLQNLFTLCKSHSRKLTMHEKAFIFACAHLFLHCKSSNETDVKRLIDEYIADPGPPPTGGNSDEGGHGAENERRGLIYFTSMKQLLRPSLHAESVVEGVPNVSFYYHAQMDR